MKSKKIIATIVAFAAFMAVATSGLAAVTTTTTYNTVSGKVEVDVDVTGASKGSEVTYLVKSNEDIVYIDQKTADEFGAVSFDYKIAKDKIVDLSTDVQFGTNGDEPVSGSDALPLTAVTGVKDDGVASITYTRDAEGSEVINDATVALGNSATDKIFALVVLESGYEIDWDKTVGLEKSSGNAYLVTGTEVNVVTKVTYVEPKVETVEEKIDETAIDDPDVVIPEGAETKIAVIKVTGVPTAVGVKLSGVEYKALPGSAGVYETGKLYAVRIISPDGTEIGELEPYCYK